MSVTHNRGSGTKSRHCWWKSATRDELAGHAPLLRGQLAQDRAEREQQRAHRLDADQ